MQSPSYVEGEAASSPVMLFGLAMATFCLLFRWAASGGSSSVRPSSLSWLLNNNTSGPKEGLYLVVSACLLGSVFCDWPTSDAEIEDPRYTCFYLVLV